MDKCMNFLLQMCMIMTFIRNFYIVMLSEISEVFTITSFEFDGYITVKAAELTSLAQTDSYVIDYVPQLSDFLHMCLLVLY